MNLTLDLRPGVGAWGLHKLRDTIPRLGPDDELTLIVDTADAHRTDQLVEELRTHGFDYQPKGSAGQAYNIVARRHLLQ